MADTFTSDTYRTLCDDAEGFLARGAFEQSRELLLKAISLIGTRPRARSLLADTCMSMELWTEAREQLEILTTLQEDEPHHHFRLGQVLEELGEYQLAADNYSVVLDRDPDHRGAGVAMKRISSRTDQTGVGLVDMLASGRGGSTGPASAGGAGEAPLKEGMQVLPDDRTDEMFAGSDGDEDGIEKLLKDIGMSPGSREDKGAPDLSEILAGIGMQRDGEENGDEDRQGDEEKDEESGETGEGGAAPDLQSIFAGSSGSEAGAATEDKSPSVSLEDIFGSGGAEEPEEQPGEPEEEPEAGEAEEPEEEPEPEEPEEPEAEEVGEPEEEPEAEEPEEPEAEEAGEPEEEPEAEEVGEPEREKAGELTADPDFVSSADALEELFRSEETRSFEPTPVSAEEGEEGGPGLEVIFGAGEEEQTGQAETAEAGEEPEPPGEEEDEEEREPASAESAGPEADSGEPETHGEEEEPEAVETTEESEAEPPVEPLEPVLEKPETEPLEAPEVASEETIETALEEPEPASEGPAEVGIIVGSWDGASATIPVELVSGELDVRTDVLAAWEATLELGAGGAGITVLGGKGTAWLGCGVTPPLVISATAGMVVRPSSLYMGAGLLGGDGIDCCSDRDLVRLSGEGDQVLVIGNGRPLRVLSLADDAPVRARCASIAALDPGVEMTEDDVPEGHIELSGRGRAFLLD